MSGFSPKKLLFWIICTLIFGSYSVAFAFHRIDQADIGKVDERMDHYIEKIADSLMIIKEDIGTISGKIEKL